LAEVDYDFGSCRSRRSAGGRRSAGAGGAAQVDGDVLGEADEELLAWPRLITISGVVEPLEELALDALPRLMTISSPPEPVAVDGGTLIGGTTGVGPTACPRGPWPPKVAARVAKADWASARSPDCSA